MACYITAKDVFRYKSVSKFVPHMVFIVTPNKVHIFMQIHTCV